VTAEPTMPVAAGEDRRGDEHRDVERAAHAGEDLLDALEEALDQARLLEQEAHEQEERIDASTVSRITE
jgi:hypothetical protein